MKTLLPTAKLLRCSRTLGEYASKLRAAGFTEQAQELEEVKESLLDLASGEATPSLPAPPQEVTSMVACSYDELAMGDTVPVQWVDAMCRHLAQQWRDGILQGRSDAPKLSLFSNEGSRVHTFGLTLQWAQDLGNPKAVNLRQSYQFLDSFPEWWKQQKATKKV